MRRQAVATIPYSEFQKLVGEDKIANVVVGQGQLSGEFKEAIGALLAKETLAGGQLDGILGRVIKEPRPRLVENAKA
jgi:hypothetical protein